MRPEIGEFDFRAANNLEGMPILNEQGQRIGEVDRVLVDMESGQIAYLVGSRAGVDVTQERFVVPWAAVDASPERQGLVVTASSADLTPATPETLSRIDREMGMEIHQHYGVAPYWE